MQRTFTGYGSPSVLFEVDEDVVKFDAGYGSPGELFDVADVAEFDPGYGTPVTVVGIIPALRAYPDEGGWMVELRSFWPIRGPYLVRLHDAAGNSHPPDAAGCYSGLPGQGASCQTNAARDTLRFALPRLAPGVYDVEVRWGEEAALLEEALAVVPANHAEATYALRGALP